MTDFKTGWFGICLVLRQKEIAELKECLDQLATGEVDHFHCSGDCNGPSGIADIEFSMLDDDETDNMKIL